ncbi:ABC transporter substrate-binding protein [Anaerobacillus alkaliphilus]|uniref:ABC transporter substrate-binding protein n=1 Tax=Anaerobacillus alkaliphilus TaxID=1548597 RepID=A0A4Q0VZ29_9BACI|nr:ABC transporter substrate-binding protein [Anaerobacillus alkaliphilus]RXJ03881.1 ABC transporter substrate-binding protein [Anaerobacillus alkaliphilus]
MKKWMLLLVSLFLAATVVLGCTSPEEGKQEEAPAVVDAEKTEVADQEEVVTTEQFPLTITDAVGNEVTLESQPTRIVSLMPSVTETLFAVGAGENVVGRSDWCNYPAEALDVASVGQMEFDLETLLSLEPDLVLAHEGGLYAAGDKLDQVRAAGIPVVVVGNSDLFEEVYGAIDIVAVATGFSENGHRIISDLKASFAEISQRAAEVKGEEKRKVWLEIDPTLWTTGSNTFMHEILETINATNVASGVEGWAQFSEEDVIVLNPDIIVTTYGYYVENPKQQILERAGWDSVSAVQNEQIFDVNADTLSRPGPRLAEGVGQLAKLIYPEVFND